MDRFETDRDYGLRRAAEERAAADHAVDERAAQAHRDLARRFDIFAGVKQPGTPWDLPARSLAARTGDSRSIA